MLITNLVTCYSSFNVQKKQNMNTVNTDRLSEEYEKRNLQIHFNLKELIPITGLKYTQLKKKVTQIMLDYGDNSSRISFKGKSYKIHYKMVDKFLPVRRRTKTIYNESWKTFYTVNPHFDSFDSDLMHSFFQSATKAFSGHSFYTAFETSYRDINRNKHGHLLTTVPPDEFKEKIKPIVNDYFGVCCDRTEPVMLKFASIKYLQKSNQLEGQVFWKGDGR